MFFRLHAVVAVGAGGTKPVVRIRFSLARCFLDSSPALRLFSRRLFGPFEKEPKACVALQAPILESPREWAYFLFLFKREGIKGPTNARRLRRPSQSLQKRTNGQRRHWHFFPICRFGTI
jgi:hypothetical protein